MKRINFEFLFPTLGLCILVFALSHQMFDVPPLGKLMDPFIGFAHNEKDEGMNEPRLALKADGLSDSVTVFFDKRKVPHIYAQNTADLYFAQGYITASLRLWQMDFLSYVAAGRLSEIFSQGYLDYDRNQRRIGMMEAARASLSMIEKDSGMLQVLNAYTKGVNAYIAQLNYRTLPLEYKLLDYQPEPWTNIKSILIMKQMANTLSGYEEDFNQTNLMLALGEAKFNQLYPDVNKNSAPVVSNYPATDNPVLGYVRKPDYLDYSFMNNKRVIAANSYNPKLGSNSWAVSGKKTKNGFPILCNDPHLTLSLPATWIEMQLTSPEMNVYGVSIPGTPAIIIGFNRQIAWGLTNGQDDVRDWYKLKITDDYRRYEFDGRWKELQYTVEVIDRKGQRPFYDTIYRTVHGPVAYTKAFSGSRPELVNHALRWEMHKPSNEFLTFVQLAKAANYQDYKKAIAHYASPVQNFIFAGRDTIAVNHQGSMPVKWAGQGKFILDGTRASHMYHRYIPQDSLPGLVNPACDYVISANQRPTDTNYTYYYNGYFNENRAARIKSLLEKENGFDIDDMQRIQLDNTNIFAAKALPVILAAIGNAALSEKGRQMMSTLVAWKGSYDAGDTHAGFFEAWWKKIKEYTWDEFRQYSFGSRLPDDQVLLSLISDDPSNEFFDRQGSEVKENAATIVQQAYEAAITTYGSQQQRGVKQWSDIHRVDIIHMTRIPAFSKPNLPAGGSPESVNATSYNWGPSWRMIVEMGDRPRAFGIYPGGQSGNIGSRYFDDFVNDWNQGRYYPLLFFINASEAKQQASATWILR